MTAVTEVEVLWKEINQFDQSLAIVWRTGEINLDMWVSSQEDPFVVTYVEVRQEEPFLEDGVWTWYFGKARAWKQASVKC